MDEKQFKRLTLVAALPLLILGLFISSNIKFLENVVYYCEIKEKSCRFFPKSNETAKIVSNIFNTFENNIVIDDLDYNQIIFNANIDDRYDKEATEDLLYSGAVKCYFSRNSRFYCKHQDKLISGDYSFKSNEYQYEFFNTLEQKALSTKSSYEKTIKVLTAFFTVLPLVLFLVIAMIIRFVINGSSSISNIDFKYYLIRLSIVFLLILIILNFLMGFKNWE